MQRGDDGAEAAALYPYYGICKAIIPQLYKYRLLIRTFF